MSEHKYEQSVASLGNWNVSLVNDEDGHLSVYLSHKDGAEIIDCQADIGNEYEWAKRFTTEKIEKDYNLENTEEDEDEDDDDE
jgi:hypothetical protein